MQRRRVQARSSQRSSQAGFTLIETIVALMLFAGVFILFYQGLSDGWRGIRRADLDAAAIALATAQLASAGVEQPLADGARSTGRQGVFGWEITIEKYTEPGDDRITDAGKGLAAYWVAVDITWPAGPLQKPRTLRLKTLKLGRS
jgi:prepilin-type N-terminal cleavage/methylation domain-containing protein